MFGIHFGNSQPSGSPLDPNLAKKPLGALSPPVSPQIAAAAMQPPVAPPAALASTPPLPTPPASIQRKKLNMFDKEHLSATLAQISRGFTSSNNFFGGLSGAASNVADSAAAYRKAEEGTTEIGGPDNAFEIHTDKDGNRTFKRIEGVADYLTEKKKAADAPKPADTANFIGDTMYAIEQLPEAQRPGAMQLMIQQGRQLGHDMSGVPAEYSPSFSHSMINRTIGARQGSTNEATRLYRADVNADRDAARESSIGFRRAADARANAAAGRSAESHRKAMRKAPPSSRRNNDLDYLR